MKKFISLLLISTLLGTVLVSCSASTPDAPVAAATTAATEATKESTVTETKKDEKTGKITIWAWDPSFNVAIMNEATAIYKASNPSVEFDVVEMAKGDLEQKLHTNLASKMTEGLPDIVLIEDYNAQKYLQSYPGAFADLTNEINYKDFAPYKVGLMTLDSKVYGVPFDSGVVGMFYRTDLLEQAGYKAADLNNITWDQFIEIGKVVKEKTGKAFLSFDKTDGGIMRVMLNSTGSWYFDAEGKPNIANNEALKEALGLYKKIIESGIAKPTSGWNEWVGAFNTGEAASVTTGVWIIGSIKSAADQSGKWAVAPVPKLNVATSVNASNLGGSSWYILDTAKDKSLAIDFMKTIYAGDNDFFQKILTDNGAVAAYAPAQSGTAYKAPDAYFGGQEVFSEMSSYMSKIPSIDYGIYTYEADAAIMSQIEDVLSGKKTVEVALKDAETQLMGQIQ